LHEAFRSLRKDAGAGVDAVTYRDYEKQANGNIEVLWEKLKSKQYRVQPLRRIYIPKEDGKLRAISIPSLEDKIVQKAMVRLLEAIWEVDFLACSYGSRPGRNPHQALDEIDRIIFRESISHVLELDITSYFDAIVRKHLMEKVERRISDSSILRLLGKWINVGVVDDGRLLISETGVGQGQVISPFLANIYLHHGAPGQTWCFQPPALRHDFMPGGVPDTHLDPLLTTHYLRENRSSPLTRVLSNSFGFGGTNCSLVFGVSG
jgi:RNA-directed DNA polymerase